MARSHVAAMSIDIWSTFAHLSLTREEPANVSKVGPSRTVCFAQPHTTPIGIHLAFFSLPRMDGGGQEVTPGGPSTLQAILAHPPRLQCCCRAYQLWMRIPDKGGAGSGWSGAWIHFPSVVGVGNPTTHPGKKCGTLPGGVTKWFHGREVRTAAPRSMSLERENFPFVQDAAHR